MKKSCNEKQCKLIEEKSREILNLERELMIWKERASIDHMTGTMNKREGVRSLQHTIKRVLKTQQGMTVAFIDIDKLKAVNDKYGHCAGDQLLIEVSNILRNNIRKDDFIFRFGGDEFVIVFSNTTKLQAKEVWARICKVVDKFNQHRESPWVLSLSVGFYEYRCNENLTADELIHLADGAMYKEKYQKMKGI